MHDWRNDVRARLSSAALHPQDEAEIVEEVAQHLEAQFAELAPTIGGTAAREALLAQLRDRAFDDALLGRRRRARPSRAGLWRRGSVWRDVRHGARSLRRSPGLVAAGVAALSLGIGLTTVMFSVIYGLLIKGLPFDEPGRIAMIYRADPAGRGEEDLVPYGDFARYRAEQRSFSAFGAYLQSGGNVSGGDRPERVEVARMTGGAFDVTAVRPLLGRVLTTGDDAPNAPPTAVLGYAMWRDRFAGDSAVLGKVVRVNGRAYTIVGVMPETYQFPRSPSLWLALQLDAASYRAGDGTPVTIVARLRPGVGYENANAELAGLSRRLARENADSAATRAVVLPFVRATVPARVYSLFYAMLGAVFLVLLVACANVANLLLDRAANRTREIGIRLALGASRLAVVRQSLVESSLLALLAAFVGTGLAQAGIVAFNRAIVSLEADRPFWMDVRLHIPVLLFVLAAAAIASVVSGVLPAIHSARVDLNTILKDESHAASSLRVGKISRAIVVAEIALSSAMLLAAGFMTKSIVQLRAVEPRFTFANVFTARVSLATMDTGARLRFLETLEHDLAATPSLAGVYVGAGLPGTGWAGDQFAVEGKVYERPRDIPSTRWLAVGPGFFRTFEVPVLRGRGILPSDHAETQAIAVVSESFVRRYFPDVEAVGRRIRIGHPGDEGPWLTIVGVVPTLFAASAVSASGNHFPPEVLTAFQQQRGVSSAVVALRGAPSAANAATLRSVVTALDPDVPIFGAASMKDVLYAPMWPVRVFGTMFVIFGIASLILAAIGLYAVMAFSVSRRLREMGIRMALGATGADVVRLACRQGAVQIIIGMALGLAAGAAFVRVARMLLYEVQPNDLTVFGLVVGVLATTGIVASIVPALGAARADPVVALRSE
jgi:putative ABC transport system permease protein